MILDFTTQMAPILWVAVGLLLVVCGMIVAFIDPELAEVYLGDRRLLAVALAVLTIVALVALRPEAAVGFGLPFR